MTIFFMKLSEPFGQFSNFYVCPFMYSGRLWKTSEHAYQAMKFESFEDQEFIRSQPNAFMAAKEGRNNSKPIRSDWGIARLPIMSEVTFCKFSQNEKEKELLVSTYPHTLIEISFKDQFWGSLPDLSGRNELGKILMKHRDVFTFLS